MSDSDKVKIVNKRTGEVSTAQTARSAMKRKDEESIADQNVGRIKAEDIEVESDAPVHEQKEGGAEPSEDSSLLTKRQRKKSAKVQINSLSDFILYAYSRKGQSLKSLAPGEVKAITKNARLGEREFEDLLGISKDDAVLAVPRHILIAMHDFDGPHQVRQEVRRLVSDVLKRHPVYQQNNLVPVVANLDDAVEPVEAIRKLANLSQEALASLTGLDNPKPKDAEALRSNSINCLALWLWESRGLRVNKVIRWLHDGYWSVMAPPDENPAACLQVLVGITEIPGVGAACQQFKAEADESALRVAGLQAKVESLISEMMGLRQTIEDLEGVVRERDTSISGLRQELDAERSAHANSRAHLGDDREYLRSNVVRHLRREVSLLAEGLQALRKDPPKVRVMDDHAERALEGLRAAIKELEEGG